MPGRLSSHENFELPAGSRGELWLIKILLRPFAFIYVVPLRGIEEIRSGKKMGHGRDYSGALIMLLYLSFSARGVLAFFTAAWFTLIAIVAAVSPTFPLERASFAGLVLGWTGALGMVTSLVRHLCWWLMRHHEPFLMRTRIVEPWRWDIVWQAIVASGSAMAYAR